jgi:hypothetical protein
MKPISTSNEARNRREWIAHRFPITDCNYHAPSYGDLSGGHWARAPKPSFLNISRDYFRKEARHSFSMEALLFAVITATAAVPLVNAARVFVHFVRSLAAV